MLTQSFVLKVKCYVGSSAPRRTKMDLKKKKKKKSVWSFHERTYFRILESSMPASERSFDGLGFCLDLAYTCGALGATEMPFSAELFCSMSHEATIDAPAKVILAIMQPMKVVAGTLSAA